MSGTHKKNKTRKTGRFGQWLLLAGVLLILVAAVRIYIAYKDIYSPNVLLQKEKKQAHLYIPTGAGFDAVLSQLISEDVITDSASFVWLAKKSGYINKVHPGHYLVKDRMSNKELINMLKTGMQTPVRVRFQNIRTRNQLAGALGAQLEADSLTILQFLNDNALMARFGFTAENAMAMFVPNTYEFYWNTGTPALMERMYKEYQTFWNEEREQAARAISLTPVEVHILASIVDEECLVRKEEPVIASVYLNRLRKGMRLQADPTVRFALGDFTINRVLKKHLEIESPYNTYKYAGLPPGPIYLPSISAIDAVLHPEKNDYLYFCAKDDLSGYHNFSKTMEQHLRYARLYQKALNKRGIKG
jgi:UPF0755 protein